MRETLDTLQCDTFVISQIRSSGDYDYYSHKRPLDKTSTEEPIDFEGFDIKPSGGFVDLTSLILILFGILLITGLVVWIYGKREKKVKKEEEEADDEETLAIERVDFDRELSEARAMGDWNKAVKAVYLRTLNYLNDQNKIIWKADKTPTEYSIEARIEPFQKMTNHFLLIRYGMYDADSLMLSDMLHCEEETKKGGGDEE